MPTYVVTGPDGKRYRVTAPEGATDAQVRAMVQGQSRTQQKSGLEQAWDATKNVAAGGVEGVLAIPDALWDAATATRRVVNQGVGAAGSAGLRAIGADSAANWWERGSAGVESDLARMPKPSTPATSFAPPPQDTAGKVARFGAQMVGGAIVPLPSAKAPPRLPRPRAAPRGVNMDVVQAGQRQKIPIRRPDAMPAKRGAMAHAKAAPYSGPLVNRALSADDAAFQARLGEIGGPGNVQSETYNLGQQIQKVGTDYISRTGKAAKQSYDEVDKLANGQRISPQNAVAEIDANIAELQAQGGFTNSATIDYLRGLRGDLTKVNGFSVPEFQGLRSAARKKISGSQELTASDAERRLGNVVSAFSEDARQQLPNAASKLLDETDAAYSQRMGFIKDVLQRHVLGRKNSPLPAERAAGNLTAMAKNRADYDTFAKFWDVADPQTKADFAATFAGKLGTKKSGEFGVGTLRTDIENVPRNIASTIYGKQGADDLADLRTIANAKAETMGAFNNSKTSDVLMRQVAPRIAGATAVGAFAGGPAGAIAAPAAMEGGAALWQLRNARSLLDPDFSKYLAQEAAASDIVSRYLSQGAIPAAANAGDELGGLLSNPYLARALSDDAEKKKKKKR